MWIVLLPLFYRWRDGGAEGGTQEVETMVKQKTLEVCAVERANRVTVKWNVGSWGRGRVAENRRACTKSVSQWG